MKGLRSAMMVMMCVVMHPAAVMGTSSVQGDDGVVKATLSVMGGTGEPPKPTVYDTLQFQLDIEPGEGVTLQEVDLARVIGPDFFVASSSGGVGHAGADGVCTFSAEIEPLASGELTIGPIEIVYTTSGLEGEERHVLTLDAMRLTIAGGLGVEEGAGPAGLRERVDAPQGMPWAALIGGGIAVAMGSAVAIVLAMRSRREAMAPPPRPAHEVALEELSGLEHGGLLERGEVEAFLARCADIVRQYIGARFGIDAPDRTTEEFLQEAAQSKVLSVGDVTLLDGFLTKIDLVKFARRPATTTEGRAALMSARSFVEQTAPREREGAAA